MPMRQECKHFESRTYANGDTVRKCDLDLAPDAPWRCPDNCSRYERILMIGSDFETGSLGDVAPVEDEPDDPTADIVDVLACARLSRPNRASSGSERRARR